MPSFSLRATIKLRRLAREFWDAMLPLLPVIRILYL